MDRQQLNLRLSAGLMTRLKQRAKREGKTVTSLVREWIEAEIDKKIDVDRQADAGGMGSPDPLELRLSTIEGRLQKLEERTQGGRGLEIQPKASKERPDPKGITEPATSDGPGRGFSGLAPIEATDVESITTAELAALTGTNRGGWNNWAAKAAVGEIRNHPTAGRWKFIGRISDPVNGGPPRSLWIRA